MSRPQGLHLYVHIPFCRYRCDYCDFFTRTAVVPRRQTEIVGAILEQSRELLPGFEHLGPVQTLYIGGGTPSSLVPEAFELLLELVESVGPTEETTIELNPEDITPDLLSRLDDSGVNRLSVGIQSLDESALRRIGRHTSSEATRAGLDVIGNYWTGKYRRRWNGDLIIGIPGRLPAATMEDLREILDRGADHLSLYELTIEPGTVLHRDTRRGLFSPPEEQSVVEEIGAVRAELVAHGFLHYEISNFARPGSESTHNLGYWRMEPHLGIGPGAVGTVPEPHPMRYTNTHDFRTFITAPDRGLTTEAITDRDFLKDLLMMGLRTSSGVSRDRITALAGMPVEKLLDRTLRRWDLRDLTVDHSIAVAPNWILPPDTRMLLNRFLRDAFAEIDERAR